MTEETEELENLNSTQLIELLPLIYFFMTFTIIANWMLSLFGFKEKNNNYISLRKQQKEYRIESKRNLRELKHGIP